MTTLHPQEVSLQNLAEKYAKGEESTLSEVFSRVAQGLASTEGDSPPGAYFDRMLAQSQSREEAKAGLDRTIPQLGGNTWAGVFEAALEGGMVPAGRIMSACGSDVKATLINCFVQPVGDSYNGTDENDVPGIAMAIAQAGETMRRGGGVGYNFSHLRPRGALVKGTQSRSSGPVTYMDVFDAMCQTVESAGARRGAQMGILDCSHPDVREFIHSKDAGGRFTGFNISVGIVAGFMQAARNGGSWELTHGAEPHPEYIEEKAASTGFTPYQREDGQWVYDQINAVDLFNEILEATYDHGDPGVVFLDRINAENNLYYAETIECTNPCAEQPLPAYGCCDLGSINLTRLVRDPFTAHASFDWDAFRALIWTLQRALDNVLDLTLWPLPEQQEEARNKRRVGQGFIGLGSTLAMLGARYGSADGIEWAQRIARFQCHEAYRASVALARERGGFPLFDSERYLAGQFIKRLPQDIRELIAEHGIRNSHSLSIAPTGTITLVFADNASNGIEPPFALRGYRTKREADGSSKEYTVEDHAFRVYQALHGPIEDLEQARADGKLPEAFVTALDLSVDEHLAMMAAVQPFIDTSISKTVNIPEDYPFEEFREVYYKAHDMGLKSVATFRPNAKTGAVLSLSSQSKSDPQDDADRRIRLVKPDVSSLASMRWPKRPEQPDGSTAWTYKVQSPDGNFYLFVSAAENGELHPFEIFINGAEAPRGLQAFAKLLSMDMRCRDRQWVKRKLESLKKVIDKPFEAIVPGHPAPVTVGSNVAALAWILDWRLTQWGWFSMDDHPTPMLDLLVCKKEPKAPPEGSLAWQTDIHNPNTGDDFKLFLSEAELEDGTRFPYSMWLSGNYPRDWDGLCKLLSFDMQIADVAWIAKKLQSIVDFPEALMDFWAQRPGSEKSQTYPSTIAYMAEVILHRYRHLGLIDADNLPSEPVDLFTDTESREPMPLRAVGAQAVKGIAACPDCRLHTVIRSDGCKRCTSCGWLGDCG